YPMTGAQRFNTTTTRTISTMASNTKKARSTRNTRVRTRTATAVTRSSTGTTSTTCTTATGITSTAITSTSTDRIGVTSRVAAVEQVLRVDVVEDLDHRLADLLGNPRALGLTVLDRVDPAVALRVVVACVNHRNALGSVVEEILRQARHGLLRNADN